jgi:hypothetical protein
LSLLDGIAEMFAELDGTDRMWEAVERYAARRNARQSEYLQTWRALNPAKVREYNRRNKKTWKRRNPQKVKAAKARYRTKHADHMRKLWRRVAAKKRAKQRPAGAPVRVHRCRGCGGTGHNLSTCAERSAA